MSGEPPSAGLDGFQAEIAAVALRAIGEHGFALAGAGALAAHGVISRPTQDLDLFTPAEGGPGEASAALLAALTDAGCQVRVLEAAEQHGGEFVRLQVRRDRHVVDIDLARDWRQHPPVRMQLGPVLHVDDAVASKVTAMIGRGLPRDYIDVAAALRRYDRDELLRLTFHRDPGLRVLDVALCMQQLDRLPDAPFADYGLTDDDVRQVRRTLQDWPRDHEQDHEGRRAHGEVHQPDRPSAASRAAAGFPTSLHDALRQGPPGAELAPQPSERKQSHDRDRPHRHRL